MASHPRYEIVDTVASGDFATVYRARDRELGREVAIKQIHQQFLSDQRQLARYWQEAQLLASLQHPNILTIYDIVRPRGWLILELMRGSLKQFAEREPMDLDQLRLALICSLSALQFLHANGVIHGDVKPSNLLLDAQNRVKLGDFGLARRATNEEGSLLKGTTKYMAPELVSNQFGPVGPASDLYSLGFSAYELMCGPQFESLFPGLTSFGRDKQIAWMMWHAAPDRNLPEIGRVLQGVPQDLARVVQKLVLKDQARRYPSAEDALADLRPHRLAAGIPEQKGAPPEAEQARRSRRKRLLTLAGVLLVSFAAVAALLFSPGKRQLPPPGPPEPAGVIRSVYPDERKLVLESSEDGKPREISVRPQHDRIFINDKGMLLRDLQPGDQVVVRVLRDESGRSLTEIRASRPVIHKGKIAALQADQGRFTLAVTEGDDEGTKLDISVPANVKIVLNAKDQIGKRPVTLSDLRVDDRVVVHHVGDQTGRAATALSAQRVVTFEGVVRNVDADKRELTFSLGQGDHPELVALPFAPQCEVTINERRFMDQQMLKPVDLRPGDRAKVAHDSQIVRIDAYRILGQAGVVQKADYSARILEVLMEGRPQPTPFLVGPACKISLAGEPCALDDLRVGDIVDITHDTPDAKSPEAKTISARRPADPNRWAILVGIQNYDDLLLTRLDYPAADAALLRDVLVNRYAVPTDQALLLTDESLVRLEQGIPALLARTTAESALIVYFAGHAYQDEPGNVYLAPKDFSFKRMASSGLPLQWLVDQLETCPAKEKLLLLDCSQSGEGADLKSEPSTAEMLRTLKAPAGMAPLRTVTAVASCQPGQRGQTLPSKQHGLFAWSLAQGLSGRGDKNRDGRLETTELFSFLTEDMASAAAGTEKAQTPELFLPDARPPRFSEDAKKAIRRLAAYLRLDRIDVGEVKTQYASVEELAANQPEPKLLYGVLLLKAKQRDEALRNLQEVSIEHPKQLLPVQGMAWLQFERSACQAGVDELAALLAKIPAPKRPSDSYPESIQRIFQWAGQLREFAAIAAPEGRRASEQSLKNLDAAAAEHGPEAERFYQQGRTQTRGAMLDFDKKIAAAKDEASAAKFRVERRRLVNYASFPFDDAAQAILGGLDQ